MALGESALVRSDARACVDCGLYAVLGDFASVSMYVCILFAGAVFVVADCGLCVV